MHDRSHDIDHFIVNHDLVLLEVLFFFLSELIFFVLVVTEDLNKVEEIFSSSIKHEKDSSKEPSKEVRENFATSGLPADVCKYFTENNGPHN